MLVTMKIPPSRCSLTSCCCHLIWGGRRREIQLLQWDALDIEEKQTGQFIGLNTKSGLDHFFPLTPWALEILAQRRERNSLWGRDGDWVFPSDQHGKPIYDYRGLLEYLKEQSGVWLTAHDMRRTVATDALELTGSEMFVSMALGHSKADSDVTMRYVKRRVGLLRPIFEQRERALMAQVGLHNDAPASSPIDALIEFLRDGKDDPTERGIAGAKGRRYAYRLQGVGRMPVLVKSISDEQLQGAGVYDLDPATPLLLACPGCRFAWPQQDTHGRRPARRQAAQALLGRAQGALSAGGSAGRTSPLARHHPRASP
jgi:hypothetical protein